MNGNLTDINRNEVLKYLGYKGGKIDDYTNSEIDRAIDLVKKTAEPKITFKTFDIDFRNGISIVGTDFKPSGIDIFYLLKDCKKVIMFAATLGSAFELELRKAQIKDMSFAVIFDSCGSSAIENICDNFQEGIEKEWEQKGMFLTDRFSPGYGDMPISQQKEFCMVLDSAKKIGVNVNKGGLLVPTKSVTAFIGVSDKEQTKRKRGCEYCKNFENCSYRKEGISCD